MNLYEQQPRLAMPHGQMNYLGNSFSPQLVTHMNQSNVVGVTGTPVVFDGQDGKRKRRLEIKNKSETKRRNKFNDQLSTLKTLLECGGTAEDAKLTRDQVMGKAIEEIQRLKSLLRNGHKDSKITVGIDLASVSNDTQVVLLNSCSKKSLNDPFNKYPWTKDDLDTTFHVLYTKEFLRIFHINRSRTAEALMGAVKTLFEIAEQLGKPEYKLYVSIMDQVFYSTITNNPKELKRVLDRNLALYNQIKSERNIDEVIVARGEVSVLIFSDLSFYHQVVGNVAESDRIWNFAFKLSQQIVNYTTRNFLLIGIPMLNYFRGNVTMEQALQYKDLMKFDTTCKETAKLLIAQVLVRSGQFDEAVKYAEDGLTQLLEVWGEAADALLGAMIIDILTKAGKLDKALGLANSVIKKCEELNIEGFASKAEILRLKAKILFTRVQQQTAHKLQIEAAKLQAKTPNLLDNPLEASHDESSLFHVDNIAVHLNFNDSQPAFDGTLSNCNNQPETQLVLRGPTDLVQVELLLQHATQLSKQRGLFIVEMRCAIDTAQVWLAFGDDMQKLEALHALEAVCDQTKPKVEELEEYAVAQKLIAELKSHVVCLFPPVFVQ